MALKDEFYVVNFHFIDDFRCIQPLSESIEDHSSELTMGPEEYEQEEHKLRAELKDLFLDAGWEGDGEINCIFIPSCFVGRQDGWCETIYHVKQDNNGTSWLAIPNHLKLSLPER